MIEQHRQEPYDGLDTNENYCILPGFQTLGPLAIVAAGFEVFLGESNEMECHNHPQISRIAEK